MEGSSDQLVVKKLARALSSEWDFEQKGIPILPVAGKGDLPIFRAFLSALEIETFVITDLDAIKGAVIDLSSSSSVKDIRDRLIKRARERVQRQGWRLNDA